LLFLWPYLPHFWGFDKIETDEKSSLNPFELFLIFLENKNDKKNHQAKM